MVRSLNGLQYFLSVKFLFDRYDLQTSGYALYTGDFATAKSIAELAPTRRIAVQVAANGLHEK